MKKHLTALALISLLESSACSPPPEGTDAPNDSEIGQLWDGIERVGDVNPKVKKLIRHSKVDLVDLYGDPTTRHEAAEQTEEIYPLLKWFMENNRVRVADELFINDLEAAGAYYKNAGAQERNDWIIILRSQLDNPEVLAHEGVHKFTIWHTDEENNYLHSHEWQDRDPDVTFALSLSSGDPAYQFGGVYEVGDELDRHEYEVLSDPERLSDNMINSGYFYIEHDGFTPQQAYDQLYRDSYLRDEVDIMYRNVWLSGHYEHQQSKYDSLGITKDDFVNMILTDKKFIDEYNEAMFSGLDSFASDFPDSEITTIQERENPEEELTQPLRDSGNPFKRLMR